MYQHVRPEGPKAHSSGQGEQREPTPWVCSVPTTWRPERAKALHHKTVCGIITDRCRAFALSGRNLCVGLLSQGVAPCSRLPWAGSFCPFRARNDSVLLYLLVVDILHSSPESGEVPLQGGEGVCVCNYISSNHKLYISRCYLFTYPLRTCGARPPDSGGHCGMSRMAARAEQVLSVKSADSA